MISWRAAGDARVERGGLARVGLPDHPHVGQPRSLDELRGAVGRAVVDHDDLDRMRRRGQRPHRRLDALPLVVRGHHHRDRAGRGGRTGCPAPARGVPGAGAAVPHATPITSSVRPPPDRRPAAGPLQRAHHVVGDGDRDQHDLAEREVDAVRRGSSRPAARPPADGGEGEPVALICGMIRSSAATVSLRSPPASCSRTTPPWPSAGTALCDDRSTPGVPSRGCRCRRTR